ncbi:MAG: 3D domain-containing protein [Anaerovoracaceae bacterium]
MRTTKKIILIFTFVFAVAGMMPTGALAAETSVSSDTSAAAETSAGTADDTASDTTADTAGSTAEATENTAGTTTDTASNSSASTSSSSSSSSSASRTTSSRQVKVLVSGLNATRNGRGAITVRWSKKSGALKYIVQRYERGKDTKYKTLATLKPSLTRYYQPLGKVQLNKTYCYRVYAVVKTGTSATKSVSSAVPKYKAVKNSLRIRKKLRVNTTAYTGGGITASGKRAAVGRVAVDPRVIKLGTWLYIPGYGVCQACDTGGAIKGKKIDVYLNSRSACRSWGRRYKNICILK